MAARLLWTVLAVIVSAGLLWWLLADVDRASLLDALAEAEPALLVPPILLVVLVQWLRAWRFSLMLSGHAGLPSWPMIDIAGRMIVFTILLPFRLGEASFPLMMRHRLGVEISRSLGILVLARLLDLCVVGGLLGLGAALALPAARLPLPPGLLLAAGLAFMALPAAMIPLLGPLDRLAGRSARLHTLLTRLLWGATMLRPPGARALAMALTLVIWLCHVLLGWLAARAILDELGLAAATLASAFSNFAFALPVPTVAGLGTVQAAWAMALHASGTPWAAGIASALVYHACVLLGVLLTGTGLALVRIWRPPPAAGAMPEA